MKHLTTAMSLAFGLLACASLAHAQASASATAAPGASKPLTAQQQKMGDCASQNKGKKGDDYKNAMKACLSGAPASAPATQQQKMSDCSKANKGKKGDDYKSAMSACLAAK